MNKTSSMTRKSFEQYDAEHLVVYFNESTSEMPAMQEGEGGQTVYEYDTVLVKGDVISVEAVKDALVGAGYDADEAEIIAASVLLHAVQDGLVEGDALALAKQMVTAQITVYDKSEAVNQFFYYGNPMWLDRDLRRELSDRIDREIERGHSTIPLDYYGQNIELPVEGAKAMLEQVKYYADDCYTQTAAHKAAIAAKRSVNTVLAYDYTTGYPAKKSFGE